MQRWVALSNLGLHCKLIFYWKSVRSHAQDTMHNATHKNIFLVPLSGDATHSWNRMEFIVHRFWLRTHMRSPPASRARNEHSCAFIARRFTGQYLAGAVLPVRSCSTFRGVCGDWPNENFHRIAFSWPSHRFFATVWAFSSGFIRVRDKNKKIK